MLRFFVSGVSVWEGLFKSGLVAVICLSHSGAGAMNCAQAKTDVEKKICASDVLNDLDVALNRNYTGMIHSDIGDGARAYLRSSQRQWLKKRNACANEECLLKLYAVRVDEVCEMPVISGIHAICETAETVLNRHSVSLPRTDARSGGTK